MNMEWFKAAGIRALKTFCQTCVAMIPIGVTVTEVSWMNVLGTGLLAAIVSIFTSVAGLPEIDLKEMYEVDIPEREDNV